MSIDLGRDWYLPFGETFVMNHTPSAKGMVYIQNFYGESKETFIKALEAIDKSVEYGCIIPDKIKVVCVCNSEIEGRYLELIEIVRAIKNQEYIELQRSYKLTPTEERSWKKMAKDFILKYYPGK